MPYFWKPMRTTLSAARTGKAVRTKRSANTANVVAAARTSRADVRPVRVKEDGMPAAHEGVPTLGLFAPW